jgi:hypothetical protein
VVTVRRYLPPLTHPRLSTTPARYPQPFARDR